MTDDVPAAAFRRWLRSHEEEVGREEVYRPPDWPFPPARGRMGIELSADGSFVRYGPGPDDRGRVLAAGRWEPAGARRLRLHAEGAPPVLVEIVAVGADELRLRTLEG